MFMFTLRPQLTSRSAYRTMEATGMFITAHSDQSLLTIQSYTVDYSESYSYLVNDS